jgi:photosystem II stability/assembly factor-like uncharacterized protein
VYRRKRRLKTWKRIDATRDLCRIWLVGDDLWVLGDHGAVLRIDPEDVVTRVELPVRADWYGLVARDPERFTMVGNDGAVAVSGDAGASWRAGDSGATGRVMGVARLGRERLIAVGESALVMTSSDGGLTWQKHKAPGAGDGCFWGVDSDDDGGAWIGGDGGRIFCVR